MLHRALLQTHERSGQISCKNGKNDIDGKLMMGVALERR